MKNLLKINGKQNFMGLEIPVVEGGFGEGQKVILAKTVAEIHNCRVNDIQDLINTNIDEFEVGVDILDLKVTDSVGYNLEQFGFTKMQISKSKNIYLLSEQGYMLLVGFMKNDKAKAIRKKLRREYFAMREIIQQQQQYKLPTTFKEALLMLVEAEEEKERLLLENETISIENRLLNYEEFAWADRNLINSLVRVYAKGEFGKAWTEYKKNLLYNHSININSRITNYTNKTGKKTKPKTLDMLNEEELPKAVATIVSMCNEANIDISEIIKHHKDKN